MLFAMSVSTGRPVETDIAKSIDRKSTRLNSSHTVISYAVFCLKKKKKERNNSDTLNLKAVLSYKNHKLLSSPALENVEQRYVCRCNVGQSTEVNARTIMTTCVM